jgi:6-phosphogluconolactonase
MTIEVLNDAEQVAGRAADLIAAEARQAVAERGRFIMAVSGGNTPWKMLRALAKEEVPWEKIHILQVDERLAPEGHTDRNLTHLHESLISNSALRKEQIYAMPVGTRDTIKAASDYALTISNIAGNPAIIDLVHLGLGTDGHTASLLPADPVLEVYDRDVALTGIYQGRHRMTLTFPIINRSRLILWIVTGSDKSEMLQRMLACDDTIPAGRITQDRAIVLADRAAAGKLKRIV